MRRYQFVFLLLVALIIASCSGFDKLVKSRDYSLMYDKALDYYEKGDHYRYTVLFEQIVPIYKGTQQADTVEFYLAKGYFHQGDYLIAGHYFDRYRSNYPRGVFTEEAEFMYAFCFYKSSPRPLLDQESTNAAIMAFNEFGVKYPQSPRRAEVNELLKELRDKLVEKSYLSSKLYFDMGDFRAAITAIKNSINTFPDSPYREEQLFLILKASYNLADNSIERLQRERFQNALDEYFNLLGEFPETKYKREAERIYANSIKVIESK